MLVMAKKKSSRPAGNKFKLIGFRPTESIRRALKECADRERRKISPMVAILVEEALLARGHKIEHLEDDSAD